jgi:HK97 family phage major capsid protein
VEWSTTVPAIDLTKIKANRQAVLDKAKALARKAVDENREFTDAEHTEYLALDAELEAYTARIRQLEGRAAADAATGAALDDILGRPVDRRHAGTSEADRKTMDEFRSMILERNPKPIDVRWEQPRTVYQPGVERRDLVKTAPANLFPVSFYGQIVEHMVESSAVLRAGATLLTTDSGEDLRVPRSTALSTAGIVAEAAAIPESDPTLGVVTLGAFKYGFMVQVSSELVEDAGFDLQGYLAREAGVAIGLGLGNHLINGNGTGQPRGVLLDAAPGVTGPAGTGTSFGSQGTAGQGTDLLLDLYASVAEPYSLANAAGWLLRSATLSTIRKLKTATQGDPVGTDFVGPPPAGSGASGEMVGKPVFIDPFMPAMANGAESTAYGDWSRYFVRMVNGLRFEVSRDFAFANDLVSFRALLRADAALIDTTGAIKTFVHTT